MLQNETQKKLKKYGWLKMMEKESNKSQALNRIRSQCNRMLDELVLLAEEVPEELVESFIPQKMMVEIMETLLKQPPKYEGEFSPLKAQLAYKVTDVCLRFFINAHESQLYNSPTLASFVTEQLWKIISTCKDIAYNIELSENLKIAERKNMTYAFKWEELPGKDVSRLLDFLEEVFEHNQTYFATKIEKSRDNKFLTFSTEISEGDIVSGKISIESDWKKAVMTFDDPNDEHKLTFIVMRENNATYLFRSRI